MSCYHYGLLRVFGRRERIRRLYFDEQIEDQPTEDITNTDDTRNSNSKTVSSHDLRTASSNNVECDTPCSPKSPNDSLDHERVSTEVFTVQKCYEDNNLRRVNVVSRVPAFIQREPRVTAGTTASAFSSSPDSATVSLDTNAHLSKESSSDSGNCSAIDLSEPKPDVQPIVKNKRDTGENNRDCVSSSAGASVSCLKSGFIVNETETGSQVCDNENIVDEDDCRANLFNEILKEIDEALDDKDYTFVESPLSLTLSDNKDLGDSSFSDIESDSHSSYPQDTSSEKSESEQNHHSIPENNAVVKDSDIVSEKTDETFGSHCKEEVDSTFVDSDHAINTNPSESCKHSEDEEGKANKSETEISARSPYHTEIDRSFQVDNLYTDSEDSEDPNTNHNASLNNLAKPSLGDQIISEAQREDLTSDESKYQSTYSSELKNYNPPHSSQVQDEFLLENQKLNSTEGDTTNSTEVSNHLFENDSQVQNTETFSEPASLSFENTISDVHEAVRGHLEGPLPEVETDPTEIENGGEEDSISKPVANSSELVDECVEESTQKPLTDPCETVGNCAEDSILESATAHDETEENCAEESIPEFVTNDCESEDTDTISISVISFSGETPRQDIDNQDTTEADMGDNSRLEEKLRQFKNDSKKEDNEESKGTYNPSTMSEIEKQRRRNLIFDEERFAETFLKCLICREVYNETDKLPKMLHCHHTFCMDCLYQMYRVEGEFRQSLTGVFRHGMPMTVKIQCPTCREGIIISEAELRRLPNDHTIMELLCFVSQTGKNDVQYCSKHQMQPLNFFCEPCIMPVCCDCTVIDHKESKGHIVVNVDEAMKKYTPIVEQTLGEIKSEKVALAEKRDSLENAQDDLDRIQKDLTRQIRAVFDNIREVLDERERELHDISETEIDRKREILEGHMKTLAERDSRLNAEFNELQKAKDDKDISLIFTGHKSARDVLANKVFVPTNSTKGFSVTFSFSSRADSVIKQQLANLGDIIFQS